MGHWTALGLDEFSKATWWNKGASIFVYFNQDLVYGGIGMSGCRVRSLTSLVYQGGSENSSDDQSLLFFRSMDNGAYLRLSTQRLWSFVRIALFLNPHKAKKANFGL